MALQASPQLYGFGSPLFWNIHSGRAVVGPRVRAGGGHLAPSPPGGEQRGEQKRQPFRQKGQDGVLPWHFL